MNATGVKRFALTLALSHFVGEGNECNLKTFYGGKKC